MTEEISENAEFDAIADQLTVIGTLTSPSELHGLLCGRLSGGLRYGDDAWIKSAIDFLDPATAVESEQREALVVFYHQTLAQLQDQHLSFLPILPDDDVEMSQRIEALGQWCYGFLNGFGTSGITDQTTLSVETAEALRDFAAFVQLDQDSDDDEESERDFAEVVEYVRVAALSVFMETGVNGQSGSHSANTKPVEVPTVH